MSRSVCIAKQGFKETPIDRQSWLATARLIDELVVEEYPGNQGALRHRVSLKSDKASKLWLSVYGVIETQNPSEELVVVMFKLAEMLGAEVYSERLKKYHSVEDWEKRTRKYRQSYEARCNETHRSLRLKLLAWAILTVLSATAGWQLSVYKQSSSHVSKADN